MYIALIAARRKTGVTTSERETVNRYRSYSYGPNKWDCLGPFLISTLAQVPVIILYYVIIILYWYIRIRIVDNTTPYAKSKKIPSMVCVRYIEAPVQRQECSYSIVLGVGTYLPILNLYLFIYDSLGAK